MNTITCISNLVMQAKQDILQSTNINHIEAIRVKYLGKRGCISAYIKKLHHISFNERAYFGKIINQAKNNIQQAITERKIELKNIELESRLSSEILDISLPGRRIKNGRLHPISNTINRIEHFFSILGFSSIYGPEIEDDYHNFDALNISAYHPARTNQDTFRFANNMLLRTQTSSMQISVMKSQCPPIRIISPGKVYRNDYDQTHTPMFHQIEGVMIDRNINFAHLKGIMHNFLCDFFGQTVQIRFRPSYFPFTEPSAEVDVMDCNHRWLEILGCGMIHPYVMRNANIDANIYSGFAFGIGIERLTMIDYGVLDLRAFFENDLRFLEQFK